MTTSALAVEALRSLDPQEVQARWTFVRGCPACGSEAATSAGTIPDASYVFGNEQVPLPVEGIGVMNCGRCGLVYKSAVPSTDYLEIMFRQEAASKWIVAHDFSAEAAWLRELTGKESMDLLDVGAADGAFLGACTRGSASERRSALDVMRYPGIDLRLAGEFIEGFLDSPSLTWSGERYDVVTLFDVVEHLYRPDHAFENLGKLVDRDGLVVIESGDVESFWPRRYGVNHWWYVRLLEHHVFWSRQALERIAADHGFKILSWERTRHKSRRVKFQTSWAFDLLKTGFYCLAPNYYPAAAQIFERRGSQPWFPFATDHFRACLTKT